MADLPRAGDMFGRYRVVRSIGRGSMGGVFEARQLDLERPVALKVLAPELSGEADFRRRFSQEARTLASLDSPNLIQVYEVGEEDGHLFIATQLISGPDLASFLRVGGPMWPETGLNLVAQVAAGLSAAHGVGLLHRDVKPSNVLIRETRGELSAYLCDFGIARTVDGDHTETSGVMGAVGYMAPERHHGVDATVASDIYSLGCLLWATLSGREPFEGVTEAQVALAHANEPVPVYSGHSWATTEVNEILSRSMAKNPAERYRSVEDMRSALQHAGAVALAGQQGSGDRTFAGPASGPVTEVRNPKPVLGKVGDSGAGKSRLRIPLLAVGAVTLIALFAVAGAALVGDDESASYTGERPNPSLTPDEPEGSTRRASPSKKQPTGPPPAPTPVASTPAAAASSAAPAESSRTISCWSGTQVLQTTKDSNKSLCGIPVGRAGLASVFPGLVPGCPSVPLRVVGKAEVYECYFSGLTIRYTRWQVGADRYRYLSEANPDAVVTDWWLDGELAGRQWLSYEAGGREKQRYQWSATYRFHTFSISVEGVTQADRARGLKLLAAKPPSRVGLR